MFDAFIKPEQLAQWLAPTGSTMRFLRAEPHVGGNSFYVMEGGGRRPLYGRVSYRTIEKPHRLVYTQHFCNEDDQVIRAPFFSAWPESMLTTVTLAAEGPERTRVTVCWQPDGATEADIAEFMKQRSGMTLGWTGSFDKLEAFLG